MSKPILFTSTRPLERAENLKTVYDAYTGEKEYCQMDIWRRHEKLLADKYALVVADEVPRDSAAPVLLIMHGILGNKLDGLDQTYPYIHPDECKNLVAAVSQSRHAKDGRILQLQEGIYWPCLSVRTDLPHTGRVRAGGD